MNADDVVSLLGLEPLPGEGGRWRQTWRDDHCSSIYFLIQPDDFSALHRLTAVELWHHYAGAPARLVLLGSPAIVLGPALDEDQRPFAAVPPGTWMGAATLGDWSLFGTTMAPGFRDDMFELGDRDALLRAFPDQRDDILRLTRTDTPA